LSTAKKKKMFKALSIETWYIKIEQVLTKILTTQKCENRKFISWA